MRRTMPSFVFPISYIPWRCPPPLLGHWKHVFPTPVWASAPIHLPQKMSSFLAAEEEKTTLAHTIIIWTFQLGYGVPLLDPSFLHKLKGRCEKTKRVSSYGLWGNLQNLWGLCFYCILLLPLITAHRGTPWKLSNNGGTLKGRGKQWQHHPQHHPNNNKN